MLAQQAHGPRIRTFLALGDILSIALAVCGAHLIRFSEHAFTVKWRQLLENPGFLIWAVISYWGLSTAAELYEPDVIHRFSETAVRAGVVMTLWGASMALATYFLPSWQFGRGILLLTLVLSPLILVNRRLLSSFLRRRSRKPVLVIGAGRDVEEFCRKLETYTSSPWNPVDGAEVPLEDVKKRVEEIGARLIVVTGSHPERRDDFADALSTLHVAGVPVVAEVDLWAWFEERLPLGSMSPELALHQHGFGPVHWDVFHRFMGVLDYLAAAVLFLVTLPLVLVAGSLVLVSDGWPVIYRQRRTGQYGRPFEMLKLRTMKRDAERAGPVFAAQDDPRVTALGRLLRRFRIDELPQLVNVLRGEMALVGPRPERPEFIAELARQIPFYTFRLAVRPGLTGWAQVNTAYARDVEGQRHKLEYDLFYIRQPSLRLYLLTLLRTANAALVGSRRRRGATGPGDAGEGQRLAKAGPHVGGLPGTSPQQRFERLDDSPQGVTIADPLTSQTALAPRRRTVGEKA